MSIDLSMIDLNSVLLVLAFIIVIVVIFVVVRFFFAHLLHLLFRGCGVIVIIVAVLALLHFLKVF
jgi:hypothetical protein